MALQTRPLQSCFGVELVGVDEERIYATAHRLLTDGAAYDRMAHAVNPYGDGLACRRIVEAVRFHLGLRDSRPEDVFAPELSRR